MRHQGEQKRGNIVLSHKALLEERTRKSRSARSAEGKVLKASSKNITDYGAFIDLGDGLPHHRHVVGPRGAVRALQGNGGST